MRLAYLRVSKEGELRLDLHEHGISAYPEYVISPLAAPGGMPRDTVHSAAQVVDDAAIARVPQISGSGWVVFAIDID